MENRIVSILLVLAGIYIILSRKRSARAIAKYQRWTAKKTKILKFFERRAKQEVDWKSNVEHIGYPLMEISAIIAGIFFIILGLFTLLGIWHFRP